MECRTEDLILGGGSKGVGLRDALSAFGQDTCVTALLHRALSRRRDEVGDFPRLCYYKKTRESGQKGGFVRF